MHICEKMLFFGLKICSTNLGFVKENIMKIAIASDHGGVDMKNALVEYFTQRGLNVTDLGTNSTESVD